MTKNNYYNEQEEQDNFLKIVGGRSKADRLQYISNNSYPKSTSNMFRPKTKEQVFEESAKSEGFSKKQINAFNSLR